jgi:hypothetical protein
VVNGPGSAHRDRGAAWGGVSGRGPCSVITRLISRAFSLSDSMSLDISDAQEYQAIYRQTLLCWRFEKTVEYPRRTQALPAFLHPMEPSSKFCSGQLAGSLSGKL